MLGGARVQIGLMEALGNEGFDIPYGCLIVFFCEPTLSAFHVSDARVVHVCGRSILRTGDSYVIKTE